MFFRQPAIHQQPIQQWEADVAQAHDWRDKRTLWRFCITADTSRVQLPQQLGQTISGGGSPYAKTRATFARSPAAILRDVQLRAQGIRMATLGFGFPQVGPIELGCLSSAQSRDKMVYDSRENGGHCWSSGIQVFRIGSFGATSVLILFANPKGVLRPANCNVGAAHKGPWAQDRAAENVHAMRVRRAR